MSDILIPSDSDLWAAAESVQSYLAHVEETLCVTEEINRDLNEENRQLKNAYHYLTGRKWDDVR